MQERILKAYQKLRDVQHGTAPALTAKDHDVAKLAASYPEAELRQAAVMRAAYDREQWKAARQQAVQA